MCSSESTPSALSTGMDSETSCFEDSDSPLLSHSVVFKCIGSTKEEIYQTTLSIGKQKMKLGQTNPVQLMKEPNNPKDSRAIAFECKPGENYVRIRAVGRTWRVGRPKN